ncbi:disease resistance protein PIK6-NP-like [Panicum virgatum]|uniref:disease resistance protein PIK6-NP-like n=1 Tax=Panicum virgatum TaxID=38727 RepID=UPI0019D67289|nr:disease resistance protein PIK6-NP-like [Panicum virgatum]
MAAPSSKVRRLSIIHSSHSKSKHGKKALEKMNTSHFRSLSVFGSLDIRIAFRILQVLDLEGCRDFKRHHVKDISQMLLLKYLSLRGTDAEQLPSSIGKMQYLETLDVRETNVTELPGTVVLLDRILHILGGDKRRRRAHKLPDDIKQNPMRSLRVLSGIVIAEGSGAAWALAEMRLLRKLAIYRLDVNKDSATFKALLSSMDCLLDRSSLSSFTMVCECSDFLNSLDSLSAPPVLLKCLNLQGVLLGLPMWIHRLSVTELTLPITVLQTDTFERLSRLHELFSLTFSHSGGSQDSEVDGIIESNKYVTGGKIVIPITKHDWYKTNLKLLRFSAPRLPPLHFSEGAMAHIERLDLQFRILEGIEGVENLQGLQQMHLMVDVQASEQTKSLVNDIAFKTREHGRSRVFVQKCHF